MKSGSRLEKVLTAGEFAVTSEIGPPASANIEAIKKKSQHCIGKVDGANFTDNQTAIVRLSSIAAASVGLSCGVEPVVQMVCRDRNRICDEKMYGKKGLQVMAPAILAAVTHNYTTLSQTIVPYKQLPKYMTTHRGLLHRTRDLQAFISL